jgi:hypothetical protein
MEGRVDHPTSMLRASVCLVIIGVAGPGATNGQQAFGWKRSMGWQQELSTNTFQTCEQIPPAVFTEQTPKPWRPTCEGVTQSRLD